MKPKPPKVYESIFAKLFLVYLAAVAIVLLLHETTEDYLAIYPAQTILGLTALFLFILVSTLLATQKILAPLRRIEAGVKEFGEGNLNVELPAVSRDEFGRIEASFNLMAERVRAMLKSKEQLLLDVSHEFRSPLSRILIALEVDRDERKSIKESVLEMETMISELLESARMDDIKGGLKKETCDLLDVVKDLASRYEGASPGVKKFEGTNSVQVAVDVPRFRIALQNILENAIKYSSHQNRPVEISVDVSDATVCISVKDFGVGIPKEHQELIFEPFYRIDRSRIRDTGGYGLGLSLARKIINAHGGVLSVESESGRGTIFRIELKPGPH
jgi:signal transduction histidine kinase